MFAVIASLVSVLRDIIEPSIGPSTTSVPGSDSSVPGSDSSDGSATVVVLIVVAVLVVAAVVALLVARSRKSS